MQNHLIIKKENLTDEIIRKIMEMDKDFYKEDLSFEFYKERYNEKNYCYCLYDQNNLVGYITIEGIKKRLYEDLKKGLYDNDYNFDTNLLDDVDKFILTIFN